TTLGLSNVSFGLNAAARQVLNSVFLHECVQAGLDTAIVHASKILPMARIPDEQRQVALDLVYDRRRDGYDPLQRFLELFEGVDAAAMRAGRAAELTGLPLWERLKRRIIDGELDGLSADLDEALAQRPALEIVNDTLLEGMKVVGDLFGSGQMQLPFVLQSAEVMKRAVARLEQYLDKLEGYSKGTVVLATVFGDVHDIGKSLVNTILTNNGYSVVDLGKQVPIGTILDAAVEHNATAIGLSALLVSTSKQMPAAVQELHERKLDFPVLVGGAAINRNFGLRILYPHGTESDDVYEPGIFYCKDAFEGLGVMDKLVDPERRAELVAKTRAAAQKLRDTPVDTDDDAPAVTDASVRSAAATDTPVPEPPYWGVRELDVPMDEVYRHLDTHVLFKLHWGGRGVKGAEWERLLREDFQPRLERMWEEQTYLHPRALLGYFPCNADGNELIVWDPEDFDPANPRELHRLVFPRQPRHDRICLSDFYRPLGSGETDVVALQAVTAGDEVTELMASLEADGEFAEQLFVHGLGVQTAEGMAEWLHARVRSELGIPPAQGRRYSWGYPSCPEQSELTKVFDLLDAPSIGLRLSGGFAVEPEQSTLAIVAHHPQAVYFGMKSGMLPKTDKQAADELIAGTDKDPTRMAQLPDSDPTAESEGEPALAEA
ncbi:MAG TPA: vitamin B12 dependent-methionine synthase activation domain-containing protein, partial [Solirubrobacteraceae bacterium]|nr:vitamin B12 dependent-methionine synthase activation domain-containing protein [Solirubrobacteraceae bacterium]